MTDLEAFKIWRTLTPKTNFMTQEEVWKAAWKSALSTIDRAAIARVADALDKEADECEKHGVPSLHSFMHEFAHQLYTAINGRTS
ncbi:MAG TPA: hypothetical protein VN843_11500 [Anaerolineales bacterium]|nr:hypothetical protein [Anaerolineales bacterium]